MKIKPFKTIETVGIAIVAVLSLLAVEPVVSSALSEESLADLAYDTALMQGWHIPGLNYSLLEVQCRSWHRNRPNRPFASWLKK